MSGGNQSLIGWVDDTTDVWDVYQVWIPSGKILNAILSYPSTEDFDLYLADSTVSFAYDSSEYSIQIANGMILHDTSVYVISSITSMYM